MTQPADIDFRQHLEIETPEHVVLDYELAGVGSRAVAAVADTLFIMLLSFAAVLLAGSAVRLFGSFVFVFYTLAAFFLIWGYYSFFEAFWRGQTPGKRMVGIRVVSDTGHPLTFGAAALRNLLRAADFFPPPYLIGGLLVALHPRAKRLGDLVAGTVVVRDRPVEAMAGARAAGAAAPEELLGPPELEDGEFRLLSSYLERASTLAPEARDRFAARLAARFAASPHYRSADPEAFLRTLHAAELDRRRGRLAVRSRAGRPGSTVERFAARKDARWREFDALARRVAGGGLDSLSAAELPDFASRYREVAADLARARTYGAGPAVRLRLERLVAAGHAALYRNERTTVRRMIRFLRDECPAAAVQARLPILLAAAVFCAPAAAGFLLLRESPELAETLLPATMLERAEAGLERSREGRAYVFVTPRERLQVASQITTNNLGVAFTCFAGGALAGVGALFLLAYNGLMLGAVTGHFANQNLLLYLWTFVIGHGVLELTAIWIAGAAGFLLGRALLAPGELRRSDALVVQGRLAVRLVGTATVLLIMAGLIEGLLSTRGGSLASQLLVSGTSLVVLLVYLGHGARTLAASTPHAPSPAPSR